MRNLISTLTLIATLSALASPVLAQGRSGNKKTDPSLLQKLTSILVETQVNFEFVSGNLGYEDYRRACYELGKIPLKALSDAGVEAMVTLQRTGTDMYYFGSPRNEKEILVSAWRKYVKFEEELQTIKNEVCNSVDSVKISKEYVDAVRNDATVSIKGYFTELEKAGKVNP